MTPLEQVAIQITELEAKIADLEHQLAKSNRRYENEKILATMMIEHAARQKQEIDQLTTANKNEYTVHPQPEDEAKTVRCSDCGNMIEIASNTTEDTYLGDFRVLKTAMCIILYTLKQNYTEWEKESCKRAVSMIKSFTEDIRLWNGLDGLEPYRWGSLGNGENYLIDKEWKK